MRDKMVDKLVREAMERLRKDNAIFCENPGFCDSIRNRIHGQTVRAKNGKSPKCKR